MHVKVKLFGPQAQSVGDRQVSVDLSTDITCGAARRALVTRFPHLSDLFTNGRFAVNCEFAPDDATLHADDEVAFIGPVSGG